ncbi:Lysine-specific demethylase 4B [Liparis tanakae]|uniref:Lysine-specific demethylase 4B n=1 Tax=Liparis tanakae TaxID=230148 RepID=A0A4Z2EDR2_9TELE|nr:Lysine-specific demethylase 4B [Liparis tanakae]
MVGTPEGEAVHASFVREHSHKSYQVEFQDQSQLILKHSEIHQLEHELPKRVRARLAIPVPLADVSSADEARAAKRRRLPSDPPPPAESSEETPHAPSTGLQMEAETPMDTSLTLDPSLDPQPPMDPSLDPSLAPPMEPSFSVDVSYMESLLDSHFTQARGPGGPLY